MQRNLFIVWSEKFELGVPIVDEQHRGAASLINSLYYIMTCRNCDSMIIPLMHTFEEYSAFHSLTEEDLLRQAEYPKLEEHIKLHEQVAIDLRRSITETIVQRTHITKPDIFMSFLRHWWMDHVCEADREFAEHVKDYIANCDLS